MLPHGNSGFGGRVHWLSLLLTSYLGLAHQPYAQGVIRTSFQGALFQITPGVHSPQTLYFLLKYSRVSGAKRIFGIPIWGELLPVAAKTNNNRGGGVESDRTLSLNSRGGSTGCSPFYLVAASIMTFVPLAG